MMTALRRADKVRSLAPKGARERLYEWHPGRAARWRRHPGLQHLRASGLAVLTFDDGPDANATPAVLDALSAADVQATFFILGEQLDAHRDIALEVVSRGHEVGLHGYQHFRHDRVAPAQSEEDIRRGRAAIEDRLGVKCRWYRPPYGKMSSAAAQACRSLGMTAVYWSAWGLDWEKTSVDRIVDLACKGLDDGAIVLLHDSARYGRRSTALPTAQAIPQIAARAEARGLSLVSLGEAVLSPAEAA